LSVSVTWKEKLTFEGKNSRGFTLPLDTNKDSGGDDNGFRPMELLIMGLAGCSGMDVISILQKKKQPVSGFEVRVNGDRASEHPRVYTHIEIEYCVEGKGVDPAAVERAVELSQTKYCAAFATLSKTAQITTKISIS
jgi:putative redox protein